MRLRPDGCITVPPEYQKELGWNPGDEVEMKVTNGALIVRHLHEATLEKDDLIACLRGKGQLKLRTDEVMKLLRGDE